MTLVEVVANLSAFEDERTIYAAKPWVCSSPAVVAPEPEDGGLPAEAEALGAASFLEVSIAREFLAGWLATSGRPIPTREQCERLIDYAIHDA